MDYLRIYETRFKETELIFDSLPIAIFAINQIFRIIRINETALDFLCEKDYKNVLDELCYKKIHRRNEVCPFCPLTNEWNQISFNEKQYHRMEKIINVKENGKEKTYKLIFILIASGSLRTIEIIEDITKEIEKQEEIIRIENLAALGTLISGIAHELNNPLTGISLNLQNLISNLSHYNIQEEEKQQLLYRLKLIQKDLLKASHIVSDILDLTKPGLKERHKLELQKIILKAKENTKRLYPVLSKKIHWYIQETNPIYVMGNADKLERMFFNLFRNSIQAYDYKEGMIEVRFRFQNDKILIIVYDEAGGIPKEILKKVFIPFATNKHTSKGSGLGLTICYNIVKEHGGKIKIRSIDNKTIFFILLPLAKE
jgi:signal transduction histidine kinase